MHLFSLIGSLATGRTSDYIGRRYTIVLAAATFLIGALIMGFAPSFLFLMAGRVVAGIGVGFSQLISPVYTSELSPAMARGFLSFFLKSSSTSEFYLVTSPTSVCQVFLGT
jgi:MFS family permease